MRWTNAQHAHRRLMLVRWDAESQKDPSSASAPQVQYVQQQAPVSPHSPVQYVQQPAPQPQYVQQPVPRPAPQPQYVQYVQQQASVSPQRQVQYVQQPDPTLPYFAPDPILVPLQAQGAGEIYLEVDIEASPSSLPHWPKWYPELGAAVSPPPRPSKTGGGGGGGGIGAADKPSPRKMLQFRPSSSPEGVEYASFPHVPPNSEAAAEAPQPQYVQQPVPRPAPQPQYVMAPQPVLLRRMSDAELLADNVAKGICSKCGNLVYNHQTRGLDENCAYIHMTCVDTSRAEEAQRRTDAELAQKLQMLELQRADARASEPRPKAGVGMTISETHPFTIVALRPTGPAESCYVIKIGDELTKVDGYKLEATLTGEEVASLSLFLARARALSLWPSFSVSLSLSLSLTRSLSLSLSLSRSRSRSLSISCACARALSLYRASACPSTHPSRPSLWHADTQPHTDTHILATCGHATCVRFRGLGFRP